jgi:ABC-2 type transport system permease protein
MIAVWKREVQSYFLSPLAYIFIGAFMIVAGIMFTINNIMSLSVSFNTTLSSMTFIFMLLVPLLTMKLISEDRKSKTDQLLLTAPLSITSIVLGKYLAAVTVFVITLLLSLVFPIILSIFGMPALGEIVSGYIGFFLLGCALIAVGVFISSITENQVISALVTFFVLLIMWMGNAALALIPSKLVVGILEWFLVYSRISPFSLGLLSITPMIYFVSFAAVFLFLAVRSIEKRRWSEG